MTDSSTRLYELPPLEDHTPDQNDQPSSESETPEEHHLALSPSISAGEVSSHEQQSRVHDLQDLMKEWYWEVLTWSFGTAAFAAIVILLIVFGNHPQERWRLRQIPITVIVAALAQTVMATLTVSVSSCIGQLKWDWLGRSRSLVDVQRFDDSSRGPAGSSLLLWDFLWGKRRPYVSTSKLERD